MAEEYKKIDFQNSTKPFSSFDFVLLEEIIKDDYSNHSPFAFHQINFFAFILIFRGKGVHSIDFVDYDCQRGTLLAIRKDQIHKFSKSNLEGVLLVFTLDFLGSFFTETEAQKSLLLFNEFLYAPKIQLDEKDLDPILALIARVKEEYHKIHDTYSSSIIRSELQVLINKLHRLQIKKEQAQADKKHLSDFIRFQNCIEQKFTLSLKVKDYAKWLGLSTKTLNTVTKSILQKTAKEFIDEICVSHIKRELINSGKPIKEISYESGFEEPSNFYNFFKKRVGKTPDVYRKNQC